MVSTETANKAYDLFKVYGYKAGAEHMGVCQESFRRYCRAHKGSVGEAGADVEDKNSLLKKLALRYSEAELQALVRGELRDPDVPQPIHNFEGETVRIGVMSDLHLGSKYTNPAFVQAAYEKFSDREVDFVTIGGDVTEGMSNRPGHVYELTHVGYDAQKEHSIEVVGAWKDTPIYMCDGNHDRWFIKAAGAIVVKDICEALPNAVFLGHDEGDIILSPSVTVKLWHGEDASCFDDKTEILTKDYGWVLFEDLTFNDQVATMTKDSHSFEWQRPTNITEEHYTGDMVHFKSRTVDCMVTPNHGMWTRANPVQLNRKAELEMPQKSHMRLNANWHRKDAGDIRDEYRRQKWQFTRACDWWEGHTPDGIGIPLRKSKNKGVKPHHYGTVSVDDAAELIGWYVTEGHARKYYTSISQYSHKNPCNYSDIVGLAERLGGPFSKAKKEVRFHGAELAEWLKDQCGHLSRHKFLPDWLKNCTTDVLELVVDVMVRGDGWKTGPSFCYKSISPRLLSDFAEIAAKCGYAVTFHDGCDTVGITKEQSMPTVNAKPSLVPYDGMIHCCEVPNGLIYVRRNGKTLWTHNSYALSYRLQKIIESFTGGEKPSMLLAGHVHKMGYFFIRNVHCISTGSIQCQSKWMRSKRMASHTGFWVVEMDINEKGIASVRPEWFPFYV